MRLLEMEKKDRMSTEKRALELLQDIKRKWKREEEQRLKVVQDEVKVSGNGRRRVDNIILSGLAFCLVASS